MEKFLLCLAQEQDLAELVRFEQLNLPDAWTCGNLKDALTSSYQQIWLLKSIDTLSTNGILHWMYLDNSVDILNFALQADYRKQGLGQSFMQGLFAYIESLEMWQNWQKNHGIKILDITRIDSNLERVKNINLEVRASNERALNCYKKLGFVCVRKVRNFYKEAAYQAPTNWDYQGETALCLQKVRSN